MNPYPFQSRQEKRSFAIWLFGIVLLLNSLVVGLALLSIYQSRQQYVARAEIQAQNLSQVLMHSFATHLDAANVGLLSVVDEAERELSSGSLDSDYLNDFLTRQHLRIPEFDTIRMTNAKGGVLFNSRLGLAAGSASAADRDYFARLRDNAALGLVISRPVIGKVSGKWALVLARRYNNPDGSFGGVVFGLISLERIHAALASINVGAHGSISLRDEQAKIIVRQPQLNGRGNLAALESIGNRLERLIAAGKRSGTFSSPVSLDNGAKTFSYHKVETYPLTVMVGLAEVDYLAPWWRDLYRVAALVALFVGTTMLISRLVYVRWRSDKLTEGELRKTALELERRVAERTADLFRANEQLSSELAEREAAQESLRQGRNMLAQVINNIPQAVFWKDRDSVYVGCNLVFARNAGLADPAEVVGKTDFDLPWLPEEALAYRQNDNEVMEQNLPKRIVEQQYTADGGPAWVDTTKVPLCKEDGEAYGVLGVYENITERKGIEEAREKALVLIESLLASSPVGIQVFDGESGDCISANRPLAEFLGGSYEGLLAQNFRTLPTWQKTGIRALAEQVLQDGATRHLETSLTSSFGKTVEIDCYLSRFHVDGRPHLLCMAIDIGERKRLEEENRLIEAQMLHVQKLESLGVLAGGIAHDFNNILMVVLGNTDLARIRLEPDSPALVHLQQIEQAANRAADLARQMLAYSGKGRFVIENLDLNQIVEEMAQMLDVSISKKVSLDYRFASGLQPISGDATQLRQVILNLVINASEAIGGEVGSISIATSSRFCGREYLSDSWIDDRLAEGSYVALEVADTGCGIPPDILPKIFDPFFSTKFTGRGLGMAAVLGIVRGHKGAIKIRSVQGKGTVFTLLFPALSDATGCGVKSLVVEGISEGTGMVLLVDDEERIRALARDMLQSLGYLVLLAGDGREALEVYRRHRGEIGCVILDLTMPEMDGEQTYEALRNLDPEVRVIISSGFNEQEVSRKFAGKGAPRFLQKPYKLSDVSGKLREIFS